MWVCPKCGSKIQNDLLPCWNCKDRQQEKPISTGSTAAKPAQAPSELFVADQDSTYGKLRAAFIIGCVLEVVLIFMPVVETVRREPGESIISQAMVSLNPHRVYTGKDIITESLKRNPGMGMLMVILFAANIVFLFLAIKQPKRSVFLAGAGLACFVFLLNFFSPPLPSNLRTLAAATIIGLVSFVAKGMGFFVNPPEEVKK